MMGANAWEPETEHASGIPIGIGRDCHVKNAIVDFNARVGDGSKLINAAGVAHIDADNYSIREGIIVVPKNAVIPPGAVI